MTTTTTTTTSMARDMCGSPRTAPRPAPRETSSSRCATSTSSRPSTCRARTTSFGSWRPTRRSTRTTRRASQRTNERTSERIFVGRRRRLGCRGGLRDAAALSTPRGENRTERDDDDARARRTSEPRPRRARTRERGTETTTIDLTRCRTVAHAGGQVHVRTRGGRVLLPAPRLAAHVGPDPRDGQRRAAARRHELHARGRVRRRPAPPRSTHRRAAAVTICGVCFGSRGGRTATTLFARSRRRRRRRAMSASRARDTTPRLGRRWHRSDRPAGTHARHASV